MNKPLITFITILLLVLVSAFVFSNSSTNENIVSESKGTITSDNIQTVTLGFKNYNYYPQQIKVKQGEPVRINLDKSVGGCYRDFTIRELDVKKYLKSSSDYVEFTPQNKGTYTFACSMGMGTGTLIVE
jgi:plastocyanin domain-containing protein